MMIVSSLDCCLFEIVTDIFPSLLEDYNVGYVVFHLLELVLVDLFLFYK